MVGGRSLSGSTDAETLILFYNKTNGATWTGSKFNWLVGLPCPSGGWSGVFCSNGADVDYLDVSSKGIVTSLPRFIFYFLIDLSLFFYT